MALYEHIQTKEKLKYISEMNPFCHRMCFFAVPRDYDKKGKSIEQIYHDSYMSSFNKEAVTQFVLQNNLNVYENNRKRCQD